MKIIRTNVEDENLLFIETFSVTEAREKYKEDFELLKELIYLFPEKEVKSVDLRRLPARYGYNLEKLEKYKSFLENLGSIIYPRGNLDADILICGIAPGWTQEPATEPMWLLGPSSRILHQALEGYNPFFSNVSKLAFYKNIYSDKEARKWIKFIEKEIEIIDPKVILFLGKYSIYDEISFNCAAKKVYHPSYILRTHKFDNWKKEIQSLLAKNRCNRYNSKEK